MVSRFSKLRTRMMRSSVFMGFESWSVWFTEWPAVAGPVCPCAVLLSRNIVILFRNVADDPEVLAKTPRPMRTREGGQGGGRRC